MVIDWSGFPRPSLANQEASQTTNRTPGPRPQSARTHFDALVHFPQRVDLF